MDKWRATFLGLKQLPRELTAFELEAFFTFTAAERQVIEDRRGSELQLGLALQIGFITHERPRTRCGAHRAGGALATSR
jgi:hypothetical protein